MLCAGHARGGIDSCQVRFYIIQQKVGIYCLKALLEYEFTHIHLNNSENSFCYFVYTTFQIIMLRRNVTIYKKWYKKKMINLRLIRIFLSCGQNFIKQSPRLMVNILCCAWLNTPDHFTPIPTNQHRSIWVLRDFVGNSTAYSC